MSLVIRLIAARCCAPLSLFLAAATLLLVPSIACQAAKQQTAPTTEASAAVIGGVSYQHRAPLDARSEPVFDTANPPKGPLAVGTYRIRYRGAGGASVPGLFTTPLSATTPVPTVLLLHGLGGSKADLLLLGVAFARRGYASLAIDIVGHGERRQVRGKPVSRLTVTEMHDLVAFTAVDLRRAMDLLETRPEVDRRKIGFLGVSLGGIIGGLFVGSEPRVRAAGLWASGGNWGRLLATSQHPFAAEFRKTNQLTTNSAIALQAKLADVDPLTVIGRAAPRPILLINGTNDTIVPRACADALFRAVNLPKERILLPGGHIPDFNGMTTQSLAFFDRKLKDPRS
ncbi:MAG: alpha/beta hydrolase [Cytophagales bacterium]|nr:alpha/beta hydrolase [Armatimonadota bacterium]